MVHTYPHISDPYPQASESPSDNLFIVLGRNLASKSNSNNNNNITHMGLNHKTNYSYYFGH